MTNAKRELERLERATFKELPTVRWNALVRITMLVFEAENTHQRELAREYLGILLREARRDVEREERARALQARTDAKLKAVP